LLETQLFDQQLGNSSVLSVLGESAKSFLSTELESSTFEPVRLLCFFALDIDMFCVRILLSILQLLFLCVQLRSQSPLRCFVGKTAALLYLLPLLFRVLFLCFPLFLYCLVLWTSCCLVHWSWTLMTTSPPRSVCFSVSWRVTWVVHHLA
jgi:hypothetical protein